MAGEGGRGRGRGRGRAAWACGVWCAVSSTTRSPRGWMRRCGAWHVGAPRASRTNRASHCLPHRLPAHRPLLPPPLTAAPDVWPKLSAPPARAPALRARPAPSPRRLRSPSSLRTTHPHLRGPCPRRGHSAPGPVLDHCHTPGMRFASPGASRAHAQLWCAAPPLLPAGMGC